NKIRYDSVNKSQVSLIADNKPLKLTAQKTRRYVNPSVEAVEKSHYQINLYRDRRRQGVRMMPRYM
ncbi:MAG: hypothetical protein LC540_08410, partial [Candidatus Thiodiazotropha sp.]|nr:hypothetical protein [Candidatus Thiodiazotropha sp.]